MLAKAIVAEGLTVRAVEDLVRQHGEDREAAEPVEAPTPTTEPRQQTAAGTATPPGPAAPTRLPPPGILELEELLSNHLNTRVKVDLSAKRGKVVVEFATLEDLERIYKLMVGRSETSVA
jgi:ParB family chromosome partitioning protein